MDEDDSEELKRGIVLVVSIVVILSFIYGYGREGGPSGTIVVPG